MIAYRSKNCTSGVTSGDNHGGILQRPQQSRQTEIDQGADRDSERQPGPSRHESHHLASGEAAACRRRHDAKDRRVRRRTGERATDVDETM